VGALKAARRVIAALRQQCAKCYWAVNNDFAARAISEKNKSVPEHKIPNNVCTFVEIFMR
jgi:hypothetical protein